jgi:hypothetical protein
VAAIATSTAGPPAVRSSEPDHAADDLAAVHGGEGLVDLVEADLAGDEAGQVEAARLPQREDAMEVGANIRGTVNAAHQLALAGEQLADAERDLVRGAPRADGHRHAAAPGRVPRLAHGRGAPDDLEDVVESGPRGQVAHGIGQAGGIDGVRSAERAGGRQLRGNPVDGHDRGRTGQPRALDHVDAHPAAPDHRDAGARLHLGGIDDGADAGHHAAADKRGHLEGHRPVDPYHRLHGHHGLLGEGADAEPERHLARGVGQRRGQPGPGPPDLGAELRLAAEAEPAPAAGRYPDEDHVIAWLDHGHAGADRHDLARALVAKGRGQLSRAQGAVLDGPVGMADAAGLQRDQDLAGTRIAQPQVLGNGERFTDRPQHRTSHVTYLHSVGRPLAVASNCF